jgi:hypothetical protein
MSSIALRCLSIESEHTLHYDVTLVLSSFIPPPLMDLLFLMFIMRDTYMLLKG